MYRLPWLPIAGLLLLFGMAGCDELVPLPESSSQARMELGRDFHSETAGTIEGQVTWGGALPEVASYRTPAKPGSDDLPRRWSNPNAPQIDPVTKAVADAVVFLRGVDPRRSGPWDHPPVRVELSGDQIYVHQGESKGSSGFVRRGDAVTLVSRQAIFHSLQARGAAFFARGFPDADRPCTRRLDRAGIVELTSGCGYFWMHARLFVDDHPYYTHTDADGRFMLRDVPPGEYELVGWLPNWHEAARELDAETALICRLTFRPAVEVTQFVRLLPRQKRTLSIQFLAERFER